MRFQVRGKWQNRTNINRNRSTSDSSLALDILRSPPCIPNSFKLGVEHLSDFNFLNFVLNTFHWRICDSKFGSFFQAGFFLQRKKGAEGDIVTCHNSSFFGVERPRTRHSRSSREGDKI